MIATPEERDYFSEMFREMDKDGNGVLTSEEFEEAMTKIDQSEDTKKVKEITKNIIKKGQNMELQDFINSAIVFNLLQSD